MTPQKLHRIAAAVVFLAAFGSYLATTYPSLSFWDCGEFIATSHSLGVPHAPGAPFFQIYQKTFSLFPFVENIARRMNIVSCIAAALTAMLTYLIGVRFIARFRPVPPETLRDQLFLTGPAIIGALVLAWSDTFWFNAIESEVYASSMFLLSLVVWLGLKWYEAADQPHNERYLLLIAYVLGLSIGVHQLSLLAFFGVALLVYFRKYTFSLKSFVIFIGVAAGLFLVIYPGIIVWLPEVLDGKFTETSEASLAVQLLPLLFVMAAVIGIVISHQRRLWFVNVYLTALLLVIAGYSTYTLTLVRAPKHPPINEGNPSNLESLTRYLNREQYGENPTFRGPTFDNLSGRVESDPAKAVWFPRRGNPEEGHASYYKRYKGDGDYFVKYQMYQMFLRYMYWNFIGRAGDVQDAPPYFAGAVTDGPEDGLWTLMPHAFPNAYYGIPMLLGLIGILFHFRRDWKFGLVLLALFAILGFVLAFYFNMAQPQPRERDYFFVGAFFVLSLWISIGAYAIVSFLEKRFPAARMAAIGAVPLLFLAAPLNMVLQNWFDHDHSRDWVPWDLSYNTLQSCDKDAILFTNGDNDTFPLWYLQEVEGVRQDVRIICLSLLNTDWYTLQLKNDRPHGALPVPTHFSDADIVRLSHFDENTIMETGWKEEKKELSLPVPADVSRRFAGELPGGAPPPDSAGSREIRWMSSARFPVQDANGTVLYIRQWQDTMVEDILRANQWKRPVYFAVTCSNDAFIGLDRYLRMEGLALRVTPVEGPQNVYIDYTAMTQCLYPKNITPSRTPQRGFLFRHEAEHRQYYDDNALRLFVNYRNAFIRLALYELQIRKDKPAVARTLDTMFAIIPNSVAPMDYRLEYDVATIYLEAGAPDRYRQLSREIEARSWREIARNPDDISSFYSPYRFLLEMYQQQRKYPQAVAVLDTILKYHPDLEDVRAKRAELQAMAGK